MRIACLLVCALLASCSIRQAPSMPELTAITAIDGTEESCEQNFVKGDWQFVHSITFSMSNDYGTTLVGITVLQGETLKTALMGVEGFVLFEAEQERHGQVVVQRAMPPFDKAGFAEGLMQDVQTLLVEPEYVKRTFAKNTVNELICRYITENNQVTDVVTASPGWNRINVYNKQGMLQQAITATDYKEVAGASIPERIQLSTSGVQSYTLNLQLLSADKL